MEEEKLSTSEAVASVLKDNLSGLEIDPRCTQIAAFNVALTAWKLAGHQPLPPLNIACAGLAPNTKRDEWLKLTEGAPHLRFQMGALYDLFGKAPVLGSLINPRADKAINYGEAMHELQPLLEKALAQETRDDTTREMAVTARGLAKAAEILAGQFTLVATNVPYLGRGKQDEVLMDYCEHAHPDAKADLSTCFVERCLASCAHGGSAALVTPQNWLFLGTYKKLRLRLLGEVRWDAVARVGEHAFESAQAAGAFAAMVGLSRGAVRRDHAFAGFDVSEQPTPHTKASRLREGQFRPVEQEGQLRNPDARIAFEFDSNAVLLCRYAAASQGIPTSDGPFFVRKFWELSIIRDDWDFHQGTVLETIPFGGREDIILFEGGKGRLRQMSAEQERDRRRDFQGANAWGRAGVAVSLMRELCCTLYTGEKFDNNVSAVVVDEPTLVPALWTYCTSPDFTERVRQIDQKLNVTNATLVKVPFDLPHWQKVAAEKYPHGLPKPFSSDPTQWLFSGHPAGAGQPLHVAVARLLGYQWPRQTGSSFPDCPPLGPDALEELADDDGIVCLAPVHGEASAADRLRKLLQTALGNDWKATTELELIRAAGSDTADLDDWLRNDFFQQHCDLFHQRPFVWHIWDGRKDGFHALVNYHCLAAPRGEGRKTLEKLTHSYLNDWIELQRMNQREGAEGSDARLAAALVLQRELEAILEGEAPYDIFVRWKPLPQQPIGWDPDINDGVRLNIRPFMVAKDVGKKGAGLLRSKPNIKWTKDRGSEPKRPKEDFPWFWCCDPEKHLDHQTDFKGGREFSGERWNNLHYTRAMRQAARDSPVTGAKK